MTPPAGMAANVVKILAVRGAGVHLDELAEVLWPDSDPGRGRTRLRNVLARIHRASGDIVQRRGESVTLADGVEVDSRRFDRAADAALAAKDPDAGEAEAPAHPAPRPHRRAPLPAPPYQPWNPPARE